VGWGGCAAWIPGSSLSADLFEEDLKGDFMASAEYLSILCNKKRYQYIFKYHRRVNEKTSLENNLLGALIIIFRLLVVQTHLAETQDHANNKRNDID
jgi:hypothetical protein